MKKTNAYNPKRKRVLTEDGEFIPFRADEKELEAHLNKKGQTLAQYKAEQKAKKEKLRKKSASGGQETTVVIKHEQTMTNEQLLAELKARGLDVPKEEDQVVIDVKGNDVDNETDNSNEEDYSEMTVKELKALADEKGILYSPKAKKDKLIDLLSNDGVTGEADSEEDDGEEDSEQDEGDSL